MINNAINPALQHVKTAADGTAFYGFKDPLTIPAIRGLGAEKAKRFVDMNVTERSLRELIRQIKVEAGAGDIVKAFSIVQEIEYRLEYIGEENSLLDLACVYFLLEEEDPNLPTEAINKKKHEIFSKDAETKSFFLELSLSIVTKFSQKPVEDMLSYFQDIKTMNERIRRYIPVEASIGSTNTSTS